LKYQAKKFKSKSAREIEIRMLDESEAQALIDLKLSYIKDSVSIPIEFDEYKNTETEERELIKKYNQSENSILLVATYNGELIGNIDLTGSERRKMHHTGMIGMGIKENWRNQGIGGLLLKSVMDWAREKSPLKIVWLDVYANNESGLALYKKMNFEISGVIKEFFKEGTQYLDKIQMWQKIK